MAHHLAGLVIHRHHTLGMAKRDAGGKIGMARQQRRQLRLIAMQQKPHAGICACAIDKTGNNSCRPTVTAHGVNRNDDITVTCGSRSFQSVRHGDACVGSLTRRGLRRILVNINARRHGHDFAGGVMATGAANVVRALLLATVRAIGGVSGDQSVMRAAHVAAGFGGAVLRDSHVETFG